MAQIEPFLGIYPRPELAEHIAALPYDVYSRAEAKIETEKEPLSFLRIDRAETQFDDDVDMYAPEVYQKAHDLLWEMIDNGTFEKEKHPCYYVYEQTMDGRTQSGIVACAAVDDYINGVIRKHENTRSDKEMDRVHHVDACDAQTGPIFLAYRHDDTIEACIERAKQSAPLFSFTAADGVSHRGFRISDAGEIEKIRNAFAGISKIYIADGHHRAASAVKVSLKRRQEAGAGSKGGEYDTFLSVLFADDELRIMDYNRIVSDLNGCTSGEFLEKLSQVCDIRENTEAEHTCEGGVCRMIYRNVPCRPRQKGHAGMYLNGTWYEITWKEKYCVSHPVDGLDVSILQREILEPILGIKDPRTDQRITFVGGIRGLGELQRQVDEKGGVAFAMFPTSMKELFAAADAHLLMPPKSTWFEPKLRSGLFIHSII
ncbi:MAG: DUF1015 family protein [Eubacteriales bacterium]|nr:DUF1015 family protein [Eubacteriales bacterium]